MRRATESTRRSKRNGAPLSLADFSDFVGLVYQGPLESVPFKSALEAIRRRLRANYVTLILRPPSSGRAALMVNASGDRPVEREADYSNYFYTLDVFVGLPTDHVVTAQELLGRRWRESEIYKQFLKPVDVLHALGADIRTEDGVEYLSSSRARPQALRSPAGPGSERISFFLESSAAFATALENADTSAYRFSQTCPCFALEIPLIELKSRKFPGTWNFFAEQGIYFCGEQFA